MSSDQDYVTILEACAIVGVSRRTIYNWLHQGLLTFKRTASGTVRIQRASLWLPPTPMKRPALEG